MMDSMGRVLLFAGAMADRRRVIPTILKIPVERPTQACGCIRAELVCDTAKRLVVACEGGFETGMRSGDWRAFEAARASLEKHLQTE